ncbi:retrotransposon protein, putative, Ty3-gypsy subclass [Cucumis melo var. makuwa]|uniref:Retrotransposon protein, putative, Ty3-gypsy subclass n=1 Tax=Cucumis melo var. makuwa TaxID=1194695 RepID=A0A5D3BWU0_CUCMM|nr:retrotransposon protein, putative, Ty3-gypsy subclass [Cucumis melo var. makuwa]TYK02599.1 retrotransposon protein, putative, Ty3-gypsy subclass [Cucumis melo var. makuwa]
MRQRRRLELVKDYDCEILYHPSKANVVADALSRKVSHSATLITEQVPLHRDFERVEIVVSYKDVLGLKASSLVAKYEERSGRLQLKWENVFMDFIIGLFRTLKGYTVIWVVVDRLTKSTHFISGKSTYTDRLQIALGTRLTFSTAFHPQTNGQIECLNQILEDMLRACVLEFVRSSVW